MQWENKRIKLQYSVQNLFSLATRFLIERIRRPSIQIPTATYFLNNKKTAKYKLFANLGMYGMHSYVVYVFRHLSRMPWSKWAVLSWALNWIALAKWNPCDLIDAELLVLSVCFLCILDPMKNWMAYIRYVENDYMIHWPFYRNYSSFRDVIDMFGPCLCVCVWMWQNHISTNRAMSPAVIRCL